MRSFRWVLGLCLVGMLLSCQDRDPPVKLSENDAKAFVYQWFAAFDRQAPSTWYTNHMISDHLDIQYPGTLVASYQDFADWYRYVQENIAWNTHTISSLEVSGSQQKGFHVRLQILWRARTHEDDELEVTIRQDMDLVYNKDTESLQLQKLRATVLGPDMYKNWNSFR